MERVYDFREQAVKAKQEVVAHLEENRDLKAKLEQVWAPFAGSTTRPSISKKVTSRSTCFFTCTHTCRGMQ